MNRPQRVVVCFANAKLPDTDYRVAFASSSSQFDVVLALPARPDPLDPRQFEMIEVGAGLPLQSYFALLRIPMLLRRRRASLALFFSTQFCIFGPPLARMVGVVPVMTVTGLGRSFSSGRWLRLCYLAVMRLNFALCKVVLFQNREDMATLLARVPRRLARKGCLIGSGIDISYFADSLDIARDPRRCVLVSRLTPAKGIDDVLELARRCPDLEFVVIGPTSKDHPLTAASVIAASRDGLLDYRGCLTSEEVRVELRRSTILVLPSRSEGLSRVAMEAVLSGCAVVGYDIPGVRAALGDEYKLANPWCVEELEDHIRALIADDGLRRFVVARAAAHVVTASSSESYVARLESVLRG